MNFERCTQALAHTIERRDDVLFAVFFLGESVMETFKSAGELLPGGGVLEIVRQAGDDPRLTLLHWNGKQSRISRRLKLAGKVYEPADVSPSFLRAIRFPVECQPYSSALALVGELSITIAKFSGLSDGLSRLVAFFSIATWVSDGVGLAPRLYVVGPQSRAVDQLITLLNCLCRHPVILASAAPAALLSLPFQFGLTLLVNQPSLTASMMQFSGASMKPNQYVVQGGRLVNPFCSVVLRVERPLGDFAPIVGLELPIWHIRKEIPFLDSSAEEAIAREFQGQLLAFRLSNLQAARTSRFDPPELTSPVSETARSIGACFSSDSDLQAEIVSLLRNADAHVRVLSSSSLEAVVVEAMLFLCHEKNSNKGGNLRVAEIAEHVRVLNCGREELQSPSPRRLGEILRALGFETTKLDRKGRGIILCRDIDRRVHELAFDFGVPLLWKGMPDCAGCKSMWEARGGRENEQEVLPG